MIETDKKNVTTTRHLTDPALFKHVLMTFSDQMSQEELDDMYEEFEFDDEGLILTKTTSHILMKFVCLGPCFGHSLPLMS